MSHTITHPPLFWHCGTLMSPIVGWVNTITNHQAHPDWNYFHHWKIYTFNHLSKACGFWPKECTSVDNAIAMEVFDAFCNIYNTFLSVCNMYSWPENRNKYSPCFSTDRFLLFWNSSQYLSCYWHVFLGHPEYFVTITFWPCGKML